VTSPWASVCWAPTTASGVSFNLIDGGTPLKTPKLSGAGSQNQHVVRVRGDGPRSKGTPACACASRARYLCVRTRVRVCVFERLGSVRFPRPKDPRAVFDNPSLFVSACFLHAIFCFYLLLSAFQKRGEESPS
jgi:hypothetical protein